MTSSLAQSFSCQDYRELASIEEAFSVIKEPVSDWIFQLKYDGIWAKIIINGTHAIIYSKTGHEKGVLEVPGYLWTQGETVLIAEYMFGSQWSQDPERKGKLFVFDCLVRDGHDVSTLPYRRRKELADAYVVSLGDPYYKLDSYSTQKLGEVWLHLEQSMKYEGIILRNKQHTWFNQLWKLKTEVEDDYIVVGKVEGEGKHAGRLGALQLGQYKPDGTIVQVMQVGGGFSDEQREDFWNRHISNLVVRVKGKSRFASGALRHPNFVQFRDDKRPEDCKIKTL